MKMSVVAFRTDNYRIYYKVNSHFNDHRNYELAEKYDIFCISFHIYILYSYTVYFHGKFSEIP